jgi:2-hydroxychromene-2-carboxylate isomerase
MGLPIDFWFDFSCPYAYLASTQRHKLARDAQSTVTSQPFLLGGVFRALGQAQNLSTTLSAPKARHNRLDVIRWAAWFDVPLATPFQHPNRPVEALRARLATPREHWDAVIDGFYRLYWVEQRNIADVAVLRDKLLELGLDADAILARAQTDAIKDELRTRTDAALAAGVFGAPAFVVNGQLFWGQDRLPFVVRAAQGWQPESGRETFQF